MGTRRLARAGAAGAAVALLLAAASSWYLFGGGPDRDGAAGNPWLASPPLVLAHRGGAHEAPESTLFAYRSALAAGADVLEVDLRATSDGALVVLHDDDVARTTDGAGEVATMTLAQVQALDAAWSFVPGRGAVPDRPGTGTGTGPERPYRGIATGERPPPAGAAPQDFRVPTLQEVLAAFPGARIAAEVKPSPDGSGAGERELVAQLRAAGRLGDVYVASGHDASLDLVRRGAPSVATAAGPREALRSVMASAGPLPGRRTAAQVLALPAGARNPVTGGAVVTRDLVEDAHRSGVAVHVFTVDDPREMADLVAVGVDGIYTDVPGVLVAVLARQGP